MAQLEGFVAGLILGMSCCVYTTSTITPDCPDVPSIPTPTATATQTPTPGLPPFEVDRQPFRRRGLDLIPWLRTGGQWATTYDDDVPEYWTEPYTLNLITPDGEYRRIILDPKVEHAHAIARWVEVFQPVAYMTHTCCNCGLSHTVLMVVTRDGVLQDWWVDRETTKREMRRIARERRMNDDPFMGRSPFDQGVPDDTIRRRP